MKGYPGQEKLDRLSAEFPTIEPVKEEQYGLSIVAHQFVFEVGTDASEAGSTTSVITATAHAALKGDLIRFTAGALANREFKVHSVETNTITLAEDLTVAPGTDAFQILRHKAPLVAAGGGISTAISFTRDGSSQIVTEDTGTPANNRPLPVKLTDFSGDMVLNAANLNLEVQLASTGANPDSVQIGNGTNLLAINASLEAQVRDDDANTTLSAINAKLVSGTDIGDVTINNAAGASAVNIQDGGNVISVDDGAGSLTIDNSNLDAALSTLATQATLATVQGDTTSLDGKILGLDLDTGGGTETAQGINMRFSASGGSVEAGTSSDPIRTDPTGSTAQPITAASLPLPAGAATESTVATVAGAVSGSEMQVDVVAALPTGANTIGGVNVIASLPAGSNNIGDVDIASSLPAGTNTIGAVNLNRLDVIDFFDTPLGDATSINGSGGAFVEFIASTAAATQKVQVMDTSGAFIGVYTGPAASEVLSFIFGPGSDSTVEIAIPIATRISMRSMEVAAPTAGSIAINFLG